MRLGSLVLDAISKASSVSLPIEMDDRFTPSNIDFIVGVSKSNIINNEWDMRKIYAALVYNNSNYMTSTVTTIWEFIDNPFNDFSTYFRTGTVYDPSTKTLWFSMYYMWTTYLILGVLYNWYVAPPCSGCTDPTYKCLSSSVASIQTTPGSSTITCLDSSGNPVTCFSSCTDLTSSQFNVATGLIGNGVNFNLQIEKDDSGYFQITNILAGYDTSRCVGEQSITNPTCYNYKQTYRYINSEGFLLSKLAYSIKTWYEGVINNYNDGNDILPIKPFYDAYNDGVLDLTYDIIRYPLFLQTHTSYYKSTSAATVDDLTFADIRIDMFPVMLLDTPYKNSDGYTFDAIYKPMIVGLRGTLVPRLQSGVLNKVALLESTPGNNIIPHDLVHISYDGIPLQVNEFSVGSTGIILKTGVGGLSVIPVKFYNPP